MDFKQQLIDFLVEQSGISSGEVSNMLSVPPDAKLGDYAFPCFKLTKVLESKNPKEAAEKLKEKVDALLPKFIEKTAVAGPYLNFYLKTALFAEEVLKQIFSERKEYGCSSEGEGKTIVVDFSAPNIAKPFGIGHLRSTIIGNALINAYRRLGYKVIGINHLGDWGTQFGKLIVAFQRWGDRSKLDADPISYLLELYVRFNKEAKEDGGALDDEARAAFKDLEDGKEEAVALWKEFSDLSLREFQRVYDLLGITFDYEQGESFYNDKMKDAIARLQKTAPTEISEGALIFNLEEYKMTPVLLRKSNGATTYHTRDLATAYYRLDTFNPEKVVYVVGHPQKLHFKQLFKMLELSGVDVSGFVHVDFGLIMAEDGSKMSTRKGTLVLLDEVLNKAISSVRKVIEEKNPSLAEKEKVAKEVGLGAVVFNDLGVDRVRDINFDWKKMLSFEGESGPYLQYTHARACSILRKAGSVVGDEKNNGIKEVDFSFLVGEKEKALLRVLSDYSFALQEMARSYKPHHVAQYLIRLAQAFNDFYQACKVISDNEKEMQARLALVDATRQVLSNGLTVLGIASPQEM